MEKEGRKAAASICSLYGKDVVLIETFSQIVLMVAEILSSLKASH